MGHAKAPVCYNEYMPTYIIERNTKEMLEIKAESMRQAIELAELENMESHPQIEALGKYVYCKARWEP